MACFWTDFVNCFEDCDDACAPFADILPQYEVISECGTSLAGWTDAHVDVPGGTFYIDFGEDSGVTSCVITGGQVKMPTSSDDCDSGCCMTCHDCDPALTNFPSFGINYHFDDSPGVGPVTIADIPTTELVQDPDTPTKFSGPLEALAPGVADLLGAFTASFNFTTNLGSVCGARFTRHSCC